MAASDEQDVRRRILDTTRHLLVNEGYAGLSMRRIARAVGFSATSIYLYFENKDALVYALIDEGMARLYQALQAAAAVEDPVLRLRGLCQAYLAFGREQPEYYEIMFLLHSAQMGRYPADRYRRARRNLELIVEALEAGRADGVFDVAQPRTAASAIWATLHGAVSLLIANRLDVAVAPEALVGAAVDQILRSYLHHAELPEP